jgi:hypothetical protein
MSFISPRNYRQIANRLGAAYAALRDELYSSTASDDTINNKTESIAKKILSISEANDDGLTHDNSVDPVGSIANDLGTAIYNFDQKFTSNNAKDSAAQYFGQFLASLNSHVIKRTTTGVASIADYFNKYKNPNGVLDMCFYTGSSANASDTNYYFSQDFQELCNRLNIQLGNNIFVKEGSVIVD